MALTDEQVARFEADGFLFPVRACDASTAAANRDAFDELEARFKAISNDGTTHFALLPLCVG